MNWNRFITVLFGLLLFNSQVEGQVLPFVHYTPESEINPLPSAESQHVFQDDQGFIWFTVFSSGLLRYDGRRMDLYSVQDGLKDLSLWGMVQDAAGRLWVSSNAGLVVTQKPLSSYRYGERITFTGEIGGTQLPSVALDRNMISADNEGNIWVTSSDEGILWLRTDGNDRISVDTVSGRVPGQPEELNIQTLLARKNGTVWAGRDNGSLIRLGDGEIVRVMDGSNESGYRINTLFEDSDGILWGGRQNGEIWWLDDENNALRSVRQDNRQLSGIVDITETTDGSLWISTAGSGIVRIDRQSKAIRGYYGRENGLISDIVFSITEDRESNIWIAQSGGVSKLRYNFDAFENYTSISYAGERPVLPSPTVGAIALGRQGQDPCKIWAGTSGGGIACINDRGESQYIRQEQGLSFNWVNGLVYDHLGRLWIGTTRGINSISGYDQLSLGGASAEHALTLSGREMVLTEYPTAGIAAVVKLRMPSGLSRGGTVPGIWFPGVRAIYGVVNETMYELGPSTGLPSSIMHAAAFDGDGHLWVGTRDRGIYRSTIPVTPAVLENLNNSPEGNNLFELYWSDANGAPTNQIETLFWHEGLMWTGTPKGLIALDPAGAETVYHISSANGFLADNAASLAISPENGHIWAGTNFGLAEVDPTTGDVLRTITRQHGLVDNEVWFYGSVVTDEDGTVYYGTARGIAVYHPDLDRQNTVPPLLHLHNVILARTSSSRNELTFEYTGLSFSNERQVRYRTRLRGYDDSWSPEKEDVSLRYTNLPAFFTPKNYTFEVMAVNESGVWSERPLQYVVPISPPWWFQWWAFLGYFVFLSVAIFVTDRIQRARVIKKERETARLREAELKAETATARSKAAEAQTRVLEVENEKKASELEKARELEKAYYELKEAQDQLIQAEKMASLGRMSAGIAHEIKNPLNFINNFAAISKDMVADLQEALENNDTEEIEYLVTSLSSNTSKIEEHGKRADSIVRSMMQHARGGQGGKEPVKLNPLIAENVNLAFHGKKAEIKNFNADIKVNLDPDIDLVTIVPQDVGRVILNIIGNAFDAVWEHYESVNGAYNPVIEVTTKKISESAVEIRVADNGPGIPEKIREKIFEPFFTTKPTGKGTGLGLSLSYDIIAQGHGGVLKVENGEDKGAVFIIRLPLKST